MAAAFMTLRRHVQLKLHDAVIGVQAERARLVDALAAQLLGQRLFRAALVLLHRVKTGAGRYLGPLPLRSGPVIGMAIVRRS